MNELAGNQEGHTIPYTTSLATQKRTAWSLWIAIVVVAAVTVVFAVLSRAEPRPEWNLWRLMVVETVTGVMFALPGLVVATRRPRNPAGWLLLVAGLGSAVDQLAHAYGLYAIPRGLLGGVLAAWVSNWSFVLFIFPVFFLFLLFPNGQLPSVRWRIPAWYVGGCGVLVLLIGVFLPGPLGGGEYFPSTPNPVGLSALSVALENAGIVAILLNFIPFLLSALSLAVPLPRVCRRGAATDEVGGLGRDDDRPSGDRADHLGGRPCRVNRDGLGLRGAKCSHRCRDRAPQPVRHRPDPEPVAALRGADGHRGRALHRVREPVRACAAALSLQGCRAAGDRRGRRCAAAAA